MIGEMNVALRGETNKRGDLEGLRQCVERLEVRS